MSVAKQLSGEFTQLVDELIDRELLKDSNPLLRQQCEDRTVLSWSNSAHLSYLFSEYGSIGQYCAILDRRDFSVCFSDGGLLQIRYDLRDDVIVAHRLCYFPCPFTFQHDDSIDFSLAELPQMLSGDELRERFKLISPIRFEFDADHADQRHSHSHVSLNKVSCRLPAYGPISMGHFVRFVLRYFYETEFLDLQKWEHLSPKLFRRMLANPPPHEFHLDTSSSFWI